MTKHLLHPVQVELYIIVVSLIDHLIKLALDVLIRGTNKLRQNCCRPFLQREPQLLALLYLYQTVLLALVEAKLSLVEMSTFINLNKALRLVAIVLHI